MAARPVSGPALPPGAFQTRACAKINLTLHVRGRRDDGYHVLDSLVAFADAADTLTLFPGNVTVLDVQMAGGHPALDLAGPDNLILRAAQVAQSHLGAPRAGRFLLDKQLPVSAGIGGGSADAAAALRLIISANALQVDDADLLAAALALGADVPMCLSSCAAHVGGIGEEIAPIDGFPAIDAVLVNVREPVSTAAVFSSLDLPRGGGMTPAVSTPSASDVQVAIRQGRNDLQAAAIRICPAISDALDALGHSGATLARMSGSGATVFGLFDDAASAIKAADAISQARPGWWVRAVVLT